MEKNTKIHLVLGVGEKWQFGHFSIHPMANPTYEIDVG